MSTTALEIFMRGKAAEQRLTFMREMFAASARSEMRSLVDKMTEPYIRATPWREVCARRARKLRKRGYEVQFVRFTPTGKARYQWRKSPTYFRIKTDPAAKNRDVSTPISFSNSLTVRNSLTKTGPEGPVST